MTKMYPSAASCFRFGGVLVGAVSGTAVRRSRERIGSGPLVFDRRQNHRLQVHAVAHRDHDFSEVKGR